MNKLMKIKYIIAVLVSVGIFNSCSGIFLDKKNNNQNIKIASHYHVSETSYGSYLAARVAHIRQNYNLAADYYIKSIKLGVKAPIRPSGEIKGSAPIAVVGPKGVVYLEEGCIIAKRHIHMAPKDAQAAGVVDGQIVSVKADNERGTVFNEVQIRVDDSFTLEMHIDTDEANASKIATGQTVMII